MSLLFSFSVVVKTRLGIHEMGSNELIDRQTL